MYKLKIFKKLTFLIFATFLLTLSVVKSVSEPDKSATILNEDVKAITVANEKAVKIYKKHQQLLNNALVAYFDKAIAAGDIVGAGVSIVKGDSIVISNGFGKKSIKSNDKVNGETVFRLGSISKGFTGVLAAKLKSEGILDWTDRVRDYLPDFQLGDSVNTNKITLAHILSQTSGTPYHSYTNLIEAGLSLSEIAKRFKEIVPISTPGELYSYQNAMFALSGEVMEKSTHQDIKTLLNTKFFKPLQMNTVSMDYETLGRNNNVALPHVRSRKGWVTSRLNDHYYNAIAAGGINASALDMAKWLRLLLGHQPEIMDKAALNEAFKPFVEIKGSSKYYQRWSGHLSSYYGFGWRIHEFSENENEKTMLHHGGSVNNYRNEIAVFPDADLGICVLLNNNSRIAQTVIPDIYKIVNEIFNEDDLEITKEHSVQVTSTFHQ